MSLPLPYRLTDAPTEFDLNAIHAYLTRTYWARGIPRETIVRAIEGSHCVAVLKNVETVAFSRVVTDHATFAYLADVYVLEADQGKGLAAAMLRYFHEHARLQGLRRWMLATRDAHGLYARYGWTPPSDPAILMQRHFPDVYARQGEPT